MDLAPWLVLNAQSQLRSNILAFTPCPLVSEMFAWLDGANPQRQSLGVKENTSMINKQIEMELGKFLVPCDAACSGIC